MSARHSSCRAKMALLHEALLHVDNLTHRSIWQILLLLCIKYASAAITYTLLRQAFGGQARLSRSLDILFKCASGFGAPRACLDPSPPFLLHTKAEEWERGTDEPS